MNSIYQQSIQGVGQQHFASQFKNVIDTDANSGCYSITECTSMQISPSL